VTELYSFRELIAQDAQVLGRNRISVFFCLVALLGLNKFSAVFLYRVASALSHKGFPFSALASLATRLNSIYNSCELSPHAVIGPGLHIPHPIGIVAGPIRAGRNLTLMQNASLALRDRSLPYEDHNNYPCLGDNVTVGPGAVLLGGVAVGDDVLIGANAVVLTDVPAGYRAVGNPARVLPPRDAQSDAVI
jgi:serine O-acetyltransferase